MAFDFGAFISGLEKKARRALPTATRRAYAPALSPGTIFSSAKPPVTVPGAILGLTGKATERVMLPVAIYEQGRQVFNPQDNILTRIGDLGSGIRNLASGKDYLEGRTTPLQRAQVGQPMVLGGQLGYKAADGTWQPRADMESENIPQYLPGSPQADKRGYVWDSNPAAERAYEQEKSRVAQLTEQDPELKRYEEASKKAKTQEEMNAARDIGMQIWQQKYGNTPMGQPGGAVGVTNPLMQRTFGYQTGSAPGQQMGEPTLGPSPLVPQIDQALNPASPNFIGGEGAPLMNFADPRFENMAPDEFQKLLNAVNKK
jgi:hypothetical protein